MTEKQFDASEDFRTPTEWLPKTPKRKLNLGVTLKSEKKRKKE